jgi:hypothetical protein
VTPYVWFGQQRAGTNSHCLLHASGPALTPTVTPAPTPAPHIHTHTTCNHPPPLLLPQRYEALPVEEFGLALLRGMGWKEGEGVGRKRQVVEAKMAVRRPERLGLGANPAAPVAPERPRPRKMGEEAQPALCCFSIFAALPRWKGMYTTTLLPMHTACCCKVCGPSSILHRHAGRAPGAFASSQSAATLLVTLADMLCHLTRHLLSVQVTRWRPSRTW